MNKIALVISILVLVAGCSDNLDCRAYSVDKCPQECVICPPCEVCSSISCQSEAFCENMGFNRSWEKDVKARLN
ncbi:Uncharacterised protein [uncultured archaeon]|nr:Uncharacterised protein [uncultured archaeon]